MQELTLESAIDVLKHDGVIVYPTETFYGIGCRISSEKAISSVFQIKKRLFALPLPTIVSGLEQVFACTSLSPELLKDTEELAEKFWPGPLTLVLPAKKSVSPLLTGGTGHIAVRLSSHPVAAALAEGAGEPLVSSSANISGQSPGTDLSELDKTLLSQADGYLKLGPAPQGGAASTLVELKGRRQLKVLREGAVPVQDLINFNFTVIKG